MRKELSMKLRIHPPAPFKGGHAPLEIYIYLETLLCFVSSVLKKGGHAPLERYIYLENLLYSVSSVLKKREHAS